MRDISNDQERMTLIDADRDQPQSLFDNADAASGFLKTMANPHRLRVLCLLAHGEKSVGELEEAVGLRQPTLSQQLARLRSDGVVETRRAGKQIFYSLSSDQVPVMLRALDLQFGTAEAVEPATPALNTTHPGSYAAA